MSHKRGFQASLLGAVAASVGLAATALPGVHEEPGTLRFVENRGQWDTPAEFVGRRGQLVVRLEPDRIVLQLLSPEDPGRGWIVHLTLEHEGPAWRPVGHDRRPGDSNFFLGNDPSRWRTQVPAWSEVVYGAGQHGVGVRIRGARGGLRIDPLSDGQPAVSVRCEGAPCRTNADGSVELVAGAGSMRILGLRFGEDTPGTQPGSTVSLRLVGSGPSGSEALGVSGHEGALPGLVWSTLLGGSLFEHAEATAFAADGSVVVAGNTASADFPVTPGAYDTDYAGGGQTPRDAFVTRFDGDGQLVFSTYLGGRNNEFPKGVGVDVQGRILVGGWTGSSDYPTTPGAFDTELNLAEGFATALSADGTELLFSTFVGGAESDFIDDVFVSPLGEVVLAGDTASTDLPVTDDAFDMTGRIQGPPQRDAFVAQVSADGSSLVYCTYLGGDSSDLGEAVHLDAAGVITVAGRTQSMDFPVTPGAFDVTFNQTGLSTPFVTRIQPGKGLIYSTYFRSGGVFDVDVDPSGAVVIVGDAGSGVPTTPGAFLPEPPGNFDMFAARLHPSGSSLIYSTYLGGSQIEHGARVHVDSAGVATVIGTTRSTNLTTTPGAFDTLKQTTDKDVFVTRLPPDGSFPLYSSYLGGSGEEGGSGGVTVGLAIDPYGRAAIVSDTTSLDFPVTPGVFDPTPNGFIDTFASKLSMLPLGVSRRGESTEGCAGILSMGITRMPRADGRDIGFTCTNAPPGSFDGVVGVSLQALSQPFVFSGADVWIDLTGLLLVLPATSNRLGYAVTTIAVPTDPRLEGLSVAAQFFWFDACAPGGLSASNALSLTLQP